MTLARRSRPRLIAAALLAIVGAGAGLSMAISDLAGLELFVAYAGMGAFLVLRRPRNALGWLLMLTGCGLALGNARFDADPAVLSSGAIDPGVAMAAWANSDGWAFAFAGIIGLASLFPSGRLAQGWMARAERLGGAAVVTLTGLIVLGPRIVADRVSGGSVNLPNPLAMAPDAGFWQVTPSLDLLYTALFAIFAAATLGLLSRFLRSTGLERQQYRWLVAAVVLVVITNGTWAVLHLVLHSPGENLAFAAVLVAYPAVPVAIGVAVMRYRLYEIDRIISRTLAYAAVTLILGGVFAVAVVGLQTLTLPVIGESELAVAASTLLVAAMFGPLRRRVQTAVDRRFNRTRYDAALVASGFGARLRDRFDVDAIRGELASTAHAAFDPGAVSVWVRSPARHQGQ